ncbi:MAG: glycosyltransferase, partial [Bacteroidales bacterium]|nr:glycosyltransferase [Bacteroidales bacterium]MBS3775181.1 glycosyltransferase [Bacteroidales bacterium]
MKPNQTIAFVNSNKAWGGGEKWHFEMGKRLREKGYPVLFVVHKKSALYKKVKEAELPHAAIVINNFSFLNLLKIRKISRLFREQRVGSVIMNLPSDVKVAGPAARKAGVEKIMYRRGTALPVNNNLYNRYLFKKVITHIITNSHATKELLLQKNSKLVDRKKFRIIYNGLDFNEFDNRPVKPIYTRKNDELIIGNASRFVEQKGHKLLVEVARKLKSREVPFQLLLAGEGKLKESIIKLAKKEGVYENLLFTGFITDIKSFMASIDIFLLTSLWEGFGYVIVEAMAGEKPVIAFDISSNPEIIRDGENGYLIPFRDTDTFAEKIITLYHKPRLREKMAREAGKTAAENFDMDYMVRQIEDLIAE